MFSEGTLEIEIKLDSDNEEALTFMYVKTKERVSISTELLVLLVEISLFKNWPQHRLNSDRYNKLLADRLSW